MATRESRVERGRRRAAQLTAALRRELRNARVTANVSQRTLARELGWSASRYRRFETGLGREITFSDVSSAAAVLGLELGAGLHLVGEAMLDRGHRALLGRFRSVLAPRFQVLVEAPLMHVGSRAWDLLLRIGSQVIGVEAETRVRDAQAFVRRVRLRERDGGAEVILVVLSDSQHNRLFADELRSLLGPGYVTSPRKILAALRAGEPVPGSGVLLL